MSEYFIFIFDKKICLYANKRKEGIFIIQITQKEALIMNSKYHVKFGEYGGISTTHTKHNKKYFLTETEKNLKFLTKIRSIESAKSVSVGKTKCLIPEEGA